MRALARRDGTLADLLLGEPASHYRRLAAVLEATAPSSAAVRCGLETALLDAFCRHLGVPLWALWGGADVRERETDITIPITDMDRTLQLGRLWYSRGFRILR